jgi:anti-sigma regulatory factor (Ser/Thr protein kinase)
LYGLTIGTSISYYAGVLVLLWYYRKPDVLIRPALKGISLLETLKVNNIGMPGGIVSVLYSLTLVLRGDMLNIAMEWFNVGETGLRAYHVQVQVGYIVNAFQISAIGVMFLFGALCTAEEDKISFKQIISKVVRYDLLAALIMSAAILCFSGVIARLYLGSGDEALASAEGVLRAFAVGILFQTAVILFANYLQVFSHFVLSALVIIVSNVIVPLFGASYGGAFEQMMSGDIVTGMFEGMTAFHILSALLLPLLIPFVNRRLHGRDLVWMMPKDFGVSPEDELRGMISNQDDVMSFSQKAGEFCTAKGKSERTSYLTSLVIEEVATNVVQHGFTKDDRDNTLSIRLVDKGDELIMRFRDDSPGFDPRSKYESLFANPDISRMIGLRMIMAEAKEVDYTSVFRLNNLIIRIDAASEHS